jgi:Ca-activated chloride channel family protein
MQRVALIGLSALGVAVCCSTAAAEFSYRSGVEVAAFAVTVLNRNGEAVADLGREDFEVREDGVVQPVTYFSAGTAEGAVPLHLGLLFDTSESMQKELTFSRNAAIRFLNTFPRALDFTLVEFDDDVRAARFSQAEFPRLVERIRSRKARGRTSLYDAMTIYLGSAYDQTGRKVLVLYTDGGDTSSSRTWDETIRLLRASDVTVYSVGFVANARGSERLMLQSKLMEIARVTGGKAAFPGSMKELEPVYDAIADEIHAQYLVGYVPTNPARDGKWRKVEIKLRKPPSERLQVRSRDGYFGPVK